MPYGLFDYGGTINTMGESPTYEQMGYNANGLPFPVLGTGTQADPFRPDTSYKFPTNTGTDGNLMVTKALPEEGPSWATNRYTDRFPEEGPVTAAIPEDGPSQQYTTMMVGEEGNPYTLRMPEEGPIPINPPSGGTGGCPAGYAPAQTGGGYPPAAIGEGRVIGGPVFPGPGWHSQPGPNGWHSQ